MRICMKWMKGGMLTILTSLHKGVHGRRHETQGCHYTIVTSAQNGCNPKPPRNAGSEYCKQNNVSMKSVSIRCVSQIAYFICGLFLLRGSNLSFYNEMLTG